MNEQDLVFHRYSNVTDENIKSLIFTVATNRGENILELLYRDDDWRILLSTSTGHQIEISWSQFLNMFFQMSNFVAEENKVMLSNKAE